ncbi:aspartic peptidase domain-containing protein [Epithele typhae]|uniref:aspartic peptidase domain-containing protein n=1 Tax=Epithele typhae TaxID=378194 RepID=UPI002007F175|nr:aspartic peptidase domain-containing protein [Epithele typhae]KAH9942250.1 aspartic peptidase domain-containing protein [Epithele typhae]
MPRLSSFLALGAFLSAAHEQVAAIPTHVDLPRSLPLVRRASPQLSAMDRLAAHKAALETKFGVATPAGRKRANGFNLLTNQGADSDYFGSVAVGTPPVAYNVILDTGSSDFWLASSSVASSRAASGIPTFEPSASSTFKNLNTPFSITYGSGGVQGTLGQDVVQLAGFEVTAQTFAVATALEQGTISAPLSGLMGLGFQSISSSGATPLWQTLASTSGTLDEPLMAFQLTRFHDFRRQSDADEPGGTFSLGSTNSSLFTGNIDFQPIPQGQEGYWIQELTGLTVNGNAVTLPSGSDSFGAIDTGTTLVAGPPDVVSQFYAQIPNSQALTGDQQGFFAFPCDSSVSVSMKFGASSVSWPVSSSDFIFEQLDGENCVGAFFALDTSGTTAPPWIIGDTFLKNVYSVFRASPAAVGFAALSDAATAQNGKQGPTPVPTVGVQATVSGAAAPTGPVRSTGDPSAAHRVEGVLGGRSLLLGALAAAYALC